MKIGEIIQSMEGIRAISEREINDIKVALKIKRIIKSLSPEVDNFNELKNDLIKKHGQEINGQFQINQDQSGWISFANEYDELCKVDVDVKVDQLTESDLGAIASVTVKELMQIDAICA